MMIDLHCHLLPGVDDGSRTMEDALELARAAVANGIHTSVLTPHIYPGVFDNQRSSLLPVFAEYRQALWEAGIPLDVRLGGEVHLHPDVFDMFARGELPMIGGLNGKKMMLLEFPDGAIPHGSDVACRMFADQGVHWLIAHPERNKAVMRNPDIIKPFVDMGCMLQLTAASVVGAFGRSAGQTAHTLLTRGLAHAHGEVTDGVTDLLAVLEGDNRITLVDAHEMWMGLPEDSVGASVDLSELDTALSKGNSLSSEPSCSNDRHQVSNTYRSNDEKSSWSDPFTALS